MGEVGDEDEVEKLKKRVLAMRAHRDAGMASASSPSRLPVRCAVTWRTHVKLPFAKLEFYWISFCGSAWLLYCMPSRVAVDHAVKAPASLVHRPHPDKEDFLHMHYEQCALVAIQSLQYVAT
jgi:hypothetical protein